jgi:hypothetical protein
MKMHRHLGAALKGHEYHKDPEKVVHTALRGIGVHPKDPTVQVSKGAVKGIGKRAEAGSEHHFAQAAHHHGEVARIRSQPAAAGAQKASKGKQMLKKLRTGVGTRVKAFAAKLRGRKSGGAGSVSAA